MHLVSWEHISPCPIGGSSEPCSLHLSSFDIFGHPNLPIKCHTLYLISGRLDDAESEFSETGDGRQDTDDVDEQDEHEDEAHVAAEENT